MKGAFRLRGARPSRTPPPILQAALGQIALGSDDAYQDTVTGEMYLGLTNLRMGTVTNAQRAGVRFQGVGIARNGAVSYATVRFVCNQADSGSVTLRIRAEAADNAATFTGSANNLTSRSATTAYVDWVVPAWSANQDDNGTLTPDIAPVVEEVVARAGWSSGNSLVLLFDVQAGTGVRRAHTFEGAPTLAARLQINATDPTPPTPPGGSGTFADGYDLFGLAGNQSFNPASPTLKDGTSITGDMLTYYNGLRHWALNYRGASTLSLIDAFDRSTQYSMARHGQQTLYPILNAFRLTGDLALLDRILVALDALKANFVTSWNASMHTSGAAFQRDKWTTRGWWMGSDAASASPYRKLLHGQDGGQDDYTGTDGVLLNATKFMAMMTLCAWALHVNRGKTSPAGRNYATEADYWGGLVFDNTKAWSETAPSSPSWATHSLYRGDQYSGDSARRPWGSYPVLARNEAHAAADGMVNTRYLGLLGVHANSAVPISNAASAVTKASEMWATTVPRAFLATTGTYGSHIVVPGNRWYRLDPAGEILRTVYTGYVALTMVQEWLSGAHRAVLTIDVMQRFARAFADMHNGTAGATYGNITGPNTPPTGYTATGSARSAAETAEYGWTSMLVFADGAAYTKLRTVALNVQASHGGGFSTPSSGVLLSALFVREALDLVDDL
jgi:hypothetical protein